MFFKIDSVSNFIQQHRGKINFACLTFCALGFLANNIAEAAETNDEEKLIALCKIGIDAIYDHTWIPWGLTADGFDPYNCNDFLQSLLKCCLQHSNQGDFANSNCDNTLETLNRMTFNTKIYCIPNP